MRLQVNNDDERLFGMTVLCAHIGSAASIVAQIRTESRGFCKCLPCRFIQPAIVGADTETALEISEEGGFPYAVSNHETRNRLFN